MFKFEIVVPVGIVAIMILLIVAIIAQPPVKPYTLVIINLETKEEVIRIEDVVWHKYSDYELVFKCKDDDKQFQEITIPSNIILQLKKIKQFKEQDVWGTTR